MSVPFNLIGGVAPFPPGIHNNPSGIGTVSQNAVEPNLVVSGSLEGALAIVDVSVGQVRHCWIPHTASITDASFVSSEPNLVVSSSRDGRICISDTRLPLSLCKISQIRLSSDREQADVMSIDVGGVNEKLLASTVDSDIKVYDLRLLTETDVANPAKRKAKTDGFLFTYSECHTDVVNFVRFHPCRRSLLFSGADDQLLLCNDTRKPVKQTEKHDSSSSLSSDEEDDMFESSSMVACINNESSPRLLRFAGSASDVLCIVSTTETIQAWQCSNLHTVNTFRNAVDAYQSDQNPPPPQNHYDEQFSFDRIIASTSSVRSCPELQSGDSAGYIVDVLYDHSSSRLFYLGGAADGRLTLFHANVDSCDPVAKFVASSGHSGVIRASQLINDASRGSVVITGGEDGSLLFWKQ